MSDPDVVRAAFVSRRSVRSFLPDPVPREIIEDLLATASRAPSGTNTQPWRVWVVSGAARDGLVSRVTDLFDEGVTEGMGEYYPSEFVEPFLSRRRKMGWDMYGLQGIEKGDWEKTRAAHRRNFEFFGAPVGLLFGIHHTMRLGGWLDIGLFMQGIMTMARAHGLDTCPQAAWREYTTVVEEYVGMPPDHSLVVGMALGYEDKTAPINQLVTERAPVAEFATFLT